MTQPTVQVLLATYNGERFLREQLDSVLSQSGVTVRILAHDDGSSDRTASILNEYARQYAHQVEVLNDGKRLGSARDNFKHLLCASSADYVAFCDQDDVWLPEKLQLSMQAMRRLEGTAGAAKPLLVFTDARVVDESLRTVHASLWHSNNLRDAASPTLASLLTENVVTGCTALLNRPLAMRMRTMPAAAQMHDHWAALLACGLGALQALPQATVLYRQHAANVIGARDLKAGLPSQLARFVGREGTEARARQAGLDRAQAASLLQLHGEALRPRERDVVRGFLDLPDQSVLRRIRTVTRFGLWRSGPRRRLAQLLDLLRSPAR